MPRNPFDYHGMPEFMIVITRWDGKGTQPREVFRSYANECTWAQAAKSFAAALLRRAGSGPALRPKPEPRRRASDDHAGL